MNASRFKSWLLPGCVLAALVGSVLVVPVLQVCRDWGYICEYTGSRKGHRQWWLGIRTGTWHQESALETFIKRNYPSELDHHWTCYAGTGRNIFGMAQLYGHGRPGPIIHLPPYILAQYAGIATPNEKKRLYDVLKNGTEAEKAASTEAVWEKVLQEKQKIEQDGRPTGNQPVRSDINQAPEAAGVRR